MPSQNTASPDRRAWRGKHRPPHRTIRPPSCREQRRQPFRPFAEVDRPRRDEHAHRARRADHSAAFSAPIIAVTISTSAPDQIQTLDPSTSTSMMRGCPSADLLSTLPSGAAALDASTTTGASGRPPISSSASRTRLATPGEQLLRCPTVEPPSKLSPTIAAFCSAVQTTASRAGGNVAAAPDPQSWTLHYALKSTRVGAPKRPDYRPATPAEKGGASTVLTRRDRTSSTRRQPSGGGFRRVDLLCRCRRRNAGDRACCPACVVDPIDLLESVGAGATWRLLNTQLIVAQTVTLEGLRRPASGLRRSSLSSSRVARPSGDRRLSCP